MKVDYSKKTSQQSILDSPENIFNYAETLRLLKETEERLEKRKKQIKVDQMRSGRGKWRAQQLQKKAQAKKEIKLESEKLQNQISSMRLKQLQKIAQMRKQSERVRQQNLKKRSMSRLQLLENKIRLNHEVRESSLHQTEKIIQLREQQLQKKREQRLSMYGSRKMSRIAYNKFHQSRVNEIRSSQSKQRDQLLQILKKRQSQLNDLQGSNASSSRVKVQKQPSTTQNLRSIDSSMRIYNPSSYKKDRKRAKSQYPLGKESGSGTLITMI